VDGIVDQTVDRIVSMASDRLDGRTAIVAGAGSSGPGVGIGRATAVVLAELGASVVVVDRDATALDETVDLVVAAGGRAERVVGDVTAPDTARSASELAMQSTGRVDVLVNNVGVFGPLGGLDGAEPQEWAAAFGVNVTAMALMARYAVPPMADRGSGSIVNLTSVAGLAGTGNDALFYATSKGAVIALTRQLASQLGPRGIRVNAVAPGMVATPMVAGRLTPALRERHRMASPLRVEGTAWEVADVVGFLAGDRARWVTGVVLPVDGGLMAVVPATEGRPAGDTEATATSAGTSAGAG
jgi:NAD(P)-dependent dehydrogenase (short-subunit alcohol dehydrogenase family)